MILFRSLAFYLALIGLGVAGSLIFKLKTPEPAREIIVQPAVNPFERTIAASGLLESADKNIEIGAPLPGIIKDVYVHVGDKVYEFYPLFRMDDQELESQLLVLKAQADVALATLNRLKSQLTRLESVTDKRAISEEELQTKHHDVLVAESQLKAAEAEIKKAEMLVDRLTVRAPKNGTILQSNIRKGEYLSLANGSPAIILGDLEKLQIRADIDEQNVCRLNPIALATAYPKNNPSIPIKLKLERIEPFVIPKRSLTGSSDERVDTRVLQVIYSIESKPAFPLYVGQQLDVFIEQNDPADQPEQESA